MRLIVGLGNPGKKYKKTRHNIGFMVLDSLHKKLGLYDVSDWSLSEKFNAKVAGCTIDRTKTVLVKPMTYMNKSGQAVQLLGEYYNITAENLITVHDDIDLEFGEIKVQKNRGHAGHNGVKSIIDHINTKNFTRVRVGVSTKKKEKMDSADFVLSKFGLLERRKLSKVVQESTEKILNLIE